MACPLEDMRKEVLRQRQDIARCESQLVLQDGGYTPPVPILGNPLDLDFNLEIRTMPFAIRRRIGSLGFIDLNRNSQIASAARGNVVRCGQQLAPQAPERELSLVVGQAERQLLRLDLLLQRERSAVAGVVGCREQIEEFGNAEARLGDLGQDLRQSQSMGRHRVPVVGCRGRVEPSEFRESVEI
jgi:hypothetical protein